MKIYFIDGLSIKQGYSINNAIQNGKKIIEIEENNETRMILIEPKRIFTKKSIAAKSLIRKIERRIEKLNNKISELEDYL